MPSIDARTCKALFKILSAASWPMLPKKTDLADFGLSDAEIDDLANALEDEFHVSIDDSAIRAWGSVGDVIRTVEHAIDVRPAASCSAA